MMPSISRCFRLVVGFVIILANLHACQVSAVGNFTQNAEHNYTRNRTMLFITHPEEPQPQQYWGSPSAVNQRKNTTPISANGNGGSQFSGVSSAALLQSLNHPLQQHHNILPHVNGDIANDIATSVLRFAINVGSELSRNAYFSKSEVFSPLSTMSALALLFVGAKGKSYQQLSRIFGLDVDSILHRNPHFPSLMHQEFGSLLQDIEQLDLNGLLHRNVDNWRLGSVHHNIRNSPKNQKPLEHIIKVSNGVFAQTDYNLNPNYKDVVATIYRSELDKFDFRRNGEFAREQINSWVSQKTFGKIPTILTDPIPKETKLILASALYFKGFWTNEFFEGATIPDKFYPDGEHMPAMKVQMMANGGAFPYYDAVEYNARIIGLPYRGNLTTMYIIQPKQSTRAKLKEFQDKITPEVIEDMIGKMVYRSAIVALPKMHIVRQFNMKDILLNLGVSDIFLQQESDLSLIGSTENYNTNHNNYPSNNPNIYQASSATAHSSSFSGQTPTQGVQSFNQNNNLNINQVSRVSENSPSFSVQAPNQGVEALIQNNNPYRVPTIPAYAPPHNMVDRYNETPLIFVSRFGEITTNDTTPNSSNETQTAEVNSEDHNTTTTKHPVEEETKGEVETEPNREKRQILHRVNALDILETERSSPSSVRSDLFVDEILHKVDIEVNEHGTEAAAATVAVLRKSGPDILYRIETPFILMIRHDPSKLVLFYGIVNEPEL